MIENVSTQLTVFHCLCPLPASRKGLRPLYVLLFLEKEAEIGGRETRTIHDSHNTMKTTRPRGYKTLFIPNQLRTKFILLINVKMPTIVGILTFISMINTTSETLKARNFFIRGYFSFCEQLKFHAQLSCA